MGRRIIRYVWVRYGHLNLEWHLAATPAFHIGPAQHAPVLVSILCGTATPNSRDQNANESRHWNGTLLAGTLLKLDSNTSVK